MAANVRARFVYVAACQAASKYTEEHCARFSVLIISAINCEGKKTVL